MVIGKQAWMHHIKSNDSPENYMSQKNQDIRNLLVIKEPASQKIDGQLSSVKRVNERRGGRHKVQFVDKNRVGELFK